MLQRKLLCGYSHILRSSSCQLSSPCTPLHVASLLCDLMILPHYLQLTSLTSCTDPLTHILFHGIAHVLNPLVLLSVDSPEDGEISISRSIRDIPDAPPPEGSWPPCLRVVVKRSIVNSVGESLSHREEKPRVEEYREMKADKN